MGFSLVAFMVVVAFTGIYIFNWQEKKGKIKTSACKHRIIYWF
jgi:hypothetical protein